MNTKFCITHGHYSDFFIECPSCKSLSQEKAPEPTSQEPVIQGESPSLAELHTPGMGEGLRYNKGKLRYDLMPTHALEQVCKVFTKGAEKYAPRNWEKGMEWSKVLESLERHLVAFKKGEDFDPETGCYHMAHLATNALFLLEYYRIFPQGDNRPHPYLHRPKIGLDIDEVLCDWIGGFQEHFGFEKKEVENWNMTYLFNETYLAMNEEERKEFYLKLKPRIKPSDIPFEPHCYITARTVDTAVTELWLEKHGFPCAPVYTVARGESKVDVARKAGIDWFVDDRFEYFAQLNRAGICCWLMDAPHNQRYDVGYKRIRSLKDLPL